MQPKALRSGRTNRLKIPAAIAALLTASLWSAPAGVPGITTICAPAWLMEKTVKSLNLQIVATLSDGATAYGSKQWPHEAAVLRIAADGSTACRRTTYF